MKPVKTRYFILLKSGCVILYFCEERVPRRQHPSLVGSEFGILDPDTSYCYVLSEDGYEGAYVTVEA